MVRFDQWYAAERWTCTDAEGEAASYLAAARPDLLRLDQSVGFDLRAWQAQCATDLRALNVEPDKKVGLLPLITSPRRRIAKQSVEKARLNAGAFIFPDLRASKAHKAASSPKPSPEKLPSLPGPAPAEAIMAALEFSQVRSPAVLRDGVQNAAAALQALREEQARSWRRKVEIISQEERRVVAERRRKERDSPRRPTKETAVPEESAGLASTASGSSSPRSPRRAHHGRQKQRELRSVEEGRAFFEDHKEKAPPGATARVKAVLYQEALLNVRNKIRDHVLNEQTSQWKQDRNMLRIGQKRVEAFLALDPKERERITKAFQIVDHENRGSLAVAGVLLVLQELGLCGTTPAERAELQEVVTGVCQSRHKSHAKEVSLEDLAIEIVPAVRRELIQLRIDAHFHQFLGACANTGERMSVPAFRTLASSQGFPSEEVERLLEPLLPKVPQPDLAGPKEKGKPTRQMLLVRAVTQPQTTTWLDFDTVHDLLLRLEEVSAHQRAAQERALQVEVGMSEEAFRRNRRDLLEIHDIFLEDDPDRSGFISFDDARMLLKKLGLEPFRHIEPHVTELLETQDEARNRDVGFAAFLDLAEQVRQRQMLFRHRKLRRLFDQVKNAQGVIDAENVVAVLAHFELLTSDTERAVAVQMLEQSGWQDESALDSSSFSCQAFERFCQGLQERLRKDSAAKSVALAHLLGLSMKKLAAVYRVFDFVDHDGDFLLTQPEVGVALKKLRIEGVTDKELEDLWPREELGYDVQSRKIDFLGFLALLPPLSKSHGGLPAEPDPVQSFTLYDAWSEKLKEILRRFFIADSFIEGLESDDLVMYVSNLLDIKPENGNLLDRHPPIRNVRQLLAFASRKARRLE